jgi:hypothetical protein
LLAGANHAGAELHARQVAFADGAQTQNEPALTGPKVRLVRVWDRRGVAQRGALDRELVCEPRPEQTAARRSHGDAWREQGCDLFEVGVHDRGQVAVPVGVAGQHVSEQAVDHVLGQGQDMGQHPGSAGCVLWQRRVAGDERPGQHPARVRRHQQVGAGQQCRGHTHLALGVVQDRAEARVVQVVHAGHMCGQVRCAQRWQVGLVDTHA